jgi:hypothetical protein
MPKRKKAAPNGAVTQRDDGTWEAIYPLRNGRVGRQAMNTQWAAELIVRAFNGGVDPDVLTSPVAPPESEIARRRHERLEERAAGAVYVTGVIPRHRLRWSDAELGIDHRNGVSE